MRYRKVGGLHFVQFPWFGFSFYRKRPRPCIVMETAGSTWGTAGKPYAGAHKCDTEFMSRFRAAARTQ